MLFTLSRRSLPVAVFAAVVALVIMLAGSDRAYASFNPQGDLTIDDPSAGANSSYTTNFNISSPDVNFGGVVFFTPPAWTIENGNNIPDGAIAGKLSSKATLGLISGACNTSLDVAFTMMDASIDPGADGTIPFLDPEVEAGDAAGDTDTDLDDQFDFGSDGLPLGVTMYPEYLTRIFPTQTPIARTYGQTVVSGIDVSLNFVLFEPGTIFDEGDLPTDPRLGYPSVTVLQSLGDPDAVPQISAITDFCAPLQTVNENYGVTQDNPETSANEGGVVRLTNPSDPGTYPFTVWSAGLRDADGDGWENLLDVCSQTPNPEWDPRERVGANQAGDQDGDALPDACDPEPTEQCSIVGGVFDCDKDGYGNRQDNCPLDPNSLGADFQAENKGPNNQADEDGDQIGDECDDNPNTPDGVQPALCIVSNVDIGAGGTPSIDPQTVLPCDPNAPPPATPPGQTPTPAPSGTGGATGGATGGTNGGTGVNNGPDSGIGSLAPSGSAVPLWALIAAAISVAGLLAGFSLASFSVRASSKDR